MNDFLTCVDYIIDSLLPVLWSFVIGNWITSLCLLITILGLIVYLIKDSRT